MKLLIAGLSKEVGGIENLFYNLFRIKNENIDIDFLAFGQECAYEQDFIKYGYKVYHIPTRRESLLRFNKNIRDFMRLHNDYDYIWYNTASTSIYQIQYYGKKYTKAQVITHSHGTSFDKNSGEVFYILNKLLSVINQKKVLNNTDLFFCCSLAAGTALYGDKYKEKLYMIKNGIDAEKYRFNKTDRTRIRNEFGIAADTVVISTIGRLSPQKNPLKAISVFEEYNKIRPNSVLLMVGTGELTELVQKEIDEKNLSDKILFLGFRDDIEKIMSGSDMLLMPSLFEGLPLTAIEAECSGLVCFLSNTITEETKITDNCYFIDLEHSSEQWAHVMDKKYRSIQNRDKYYEQITKVGYSIEQTRSYVSKLLEDNLL